jgi:hypothetical protein
MHPDTYLFLANERIADLHRDADRRRQTNRVAVGWRATIHHREAPAPVGVPGTPLTGQRGAG